MSVTTILFIDVVGIQITTIAYINSKTCRYVFVGSLPVLRAKAWGCVLQLLSIGKWIMFDSCIIGLLYFVHYIRGVMKMSYAPVLLLLINCRCLTCLTQSTMESWVLKSLLVHFLYFIQMRQLTIRLNVC